MTYYKMLAHMILETEKPHDLPSARQRPRKNSGVDSSPNHKAWEPEELMM